MKIRRDDIDAMVPNSCQSERTKIIQNLPQGLSAEIADNFRSAGIELSGKN
jgi:hypothetical protein